MCALRMEAEDEEDVFIRTGDVLCLFANNRGYLAAEGFGSQRCRLEKDDKNKDVPRELSKCTLRLEDALSTHAMYTQGPRSREKSGACSSKILMYGQAVLLQHTETKKFLCCLPSSLEGDKAAYHIGFAEYDDHGTLNENFWFSVHPATAHRSTGEKVRNGDEVHLVNIANEHYLSVCVGGGDLGGGTAEDIQASIHHYIWSLHIVWSASVKQEAIGSLNGGNIIRLLHRHGEDCLSWAGREQGVCFDCSEPKYHLASLWCVELFTLRFGWGFVGMGQPFRLRHKVTGRYLGQKDRQLALLDSSEASEDASAFCLTSVTTSSPVVWAGEEGPNSMGKPEFTFGDSVVYLYHISSKRYVGCLPSDQAKGLGKRELLHSQPNQNLALTITRSSEEHAQASTLIQLFQDTMSQYKNCLSEGKDASGVETMLSYICDYFKMPDATLCYDQYQTILCVRKERQNLFRHQGISLLTPSVIMESTKCSTTQKMLQRFYALLTAMIGGNHGNCKAFATQEWLDTFIAQLELTWLVDDVLDILLCLLNDSPEFLNIFTDNHINAVVSLLNREGRNRKVMKVLSSLCVCHGVSMRDKQRLICNHLLNYHDILLQTTMCQKIKCAHLNVYVGASSSALSKHWYYEVKVLTHSGHLRVGWAHATNFCTHPISTGDVLTAGGLGDDLYSIGFDGDACWVGGHPLHHSPVKVLEAGDVVGCCIDVEKGIAFFTRNGTQVPGYTKLTYLTELATPSVSLSPGASVVIVLGGEAGMLKYPPPPGYSALCEAILPGKVVESLVFDSCGHGYKLEGPLVISDSHGFVPTVIETLEDIPDPVKCVQEQLAKNIHEVWSKNKIDSGYSYGSVRNDQLKQHPCLLSYEGLSETDKTYDRSMALSTLKTLIALGYGISLDATSVPDPPFLALDPSQYQQPNGYLPRPLDLSKVNVQPELLSLVDKLAENAHNLWASTRIREGWTYGLASVAAEKRNPALVPYACLSDSLKKSNYDTALETVRTLCGLGCIIEPPPVNGGSIHELRRKQADHITMETRTFRAQRCYAVTRGRWCYEVKILTDDGTIRVGWASPYLAADQKLGTDENAFCFDGYLGSKWHQHSNNFGQRWKAGDIVCCMVDLDLRTIAFALNGKTLEDELGSNCAFEHIVAPNGLVPAVMLSTGQEVQLNFGHAREFLHLSHANLGYLPLAQLTDGDIPLWYSSPDTMFYPISDTHPRLKGRWGRCHDGEDSTRVAISYKEWDYSSCRSYAECLRLNTGVRVGSAESFPPQALKVSYTAIIPAGHDPKAVFIGWTTSSFRYAKEEEGSRPGEESQQGRPGEESLQGRPGQRVEWLRELTSSDVVCSSTAYLMCLSDMLDKPQPPLHSSLSVTCLLDSGTGVMSFHLSDLEYPSPVLTMTTTAPCKLFPTIIMSSHLEHLVTIDYAPFTGCSPLTSVLLTPNCTRDLPVCPPRVKVCALDLSRWLPYVSMETAVTTSLIPKQGYSVAVNGDVQPSIYFTLHDEDTTLSIFELVEYPDLLSFHLATLETLVAVSSHANLEAAKAVDGVMGKELLMQCVKMDGIDHSLKAACFELLIVLHMEPMAEAKLMTRGEFIVPLSQLTHTAPLSQLTHTAPLSQLTHTATADKRKQSVSDTLAMWSSLSLNSSVCSTLDDLKELVLHSLSSIVSKENSRSFCPPAQKDKTHPLVPLLRVLDSLLVVGSMRHKDDFDRLFKLLDPAAFGNSGCGLLTMDRDEPTKVALCSVLQHLCDRQLHSRVMDTVSFAQSYVGHLQHDQEGRYSMTDWEFRSPPDYQLGHMLKFSAKGCPTNPSLQRTFKDFCSNLISQCSCVGGEGEDYQELRREDMPLRQKLQRIWEMVWSSKAEGTSPPGEVTSLQSLIRNTMLDWAKGCIRDPELVEKIFLLLFRQFDVAQEVIRAIRNTYIIDDSSRWYNIPMFQQALGTLRGLVKVAMGKEEEKILKKSFSDIKDSGLFYCHPYLMCSSGVHTVVIDILRQHVNMGPLAKQLDQQSDQVEVCCKFLCSFARINRDTQHAVFGHLGVLLDFMKLSPVLMATRNCTPLDVAIVAIRNNTELAMSLSEAHLEAVVSILLATTTCGEAWGPVGGKRCLEFLQCAVWSEGDQIQGNAYTIVRLLIYHSKCLGPALDSNAGLYQTFQDNLRMLDDELCSRKEESGAEEQTRPPTLMQSVLTFYASLLQLLGYCCHTQKSAVDIQEISLEHRSLIDRTRHILKNLVSQADVTALLVMPFDSNGSPLLLPQYKKSTLLFVERVYGLNDPDYTLRLLTEAFLPDIKLALQFLNRKVVPMLTQPLLSYLCDSVLPALTRHSSVFQQLHKRLHIIQDLLTSVYRLMYAATLSLNQLDQISDFIIAVVQNIHPRAILLFAPKVLSERPFVQPRSRVVLKLFTAHYQHFRHFFDGSQGTSKNVSGFAGEEEKIITAQVVYHFIQGLDEGCLLANKQLLQDAVCCLKAMVVTLSPDSHVPPFRASALVSESAGYEPHPPDISGVPLFSEIVQVVNEFARFQHDCYVFEKQSLGWKYDTEFSADHKCDPLLVPFDSLSQRHKDDLLAPAEQSLKLLLFRGWALNKVPAIDTRSIPRKVRTFCARKRKNSLYVPYEPEVLDLSKLEVSLELLALAGRMAEDAHNLWAKKLSHSDSNYSSNPLYCHYEMLDDHVKDERRTYALDLIKYLGVLGFQPLPSREMASFGYQPQNSSSMAKFGLQLIEIINNKLIETINNKLSSKSHNLNFLTNVMFPILSSYLTRYRPYFLRHNHPCLSTKEERTKIIEMFFSLITFASENKDVLFSTSDAGTNQTCAPSQVGASVVKLINIVARIFDVRILTDTSKGSKAPTLNAAVVAFFEEASSAIKETAGALNGAVTTASLYCLHALLPILTHFLEHVDFHNTTENVIQGEVTQCCQTMFESLWSVAKEGGVKCVTSGSMAGIGQCLGALARVNLKLFSTGECSVDALQERLRKVGTCTRDSEETMLTAFIVVPVLASVLSKGDELIEGIELALSYVWALLSKVSSTDVVPWLYHVVGNTHGLTRACSPDVLETSLLSLVTQAASRSIALYREELLARESEHKDQFKKVHEAYRVLARDLVASLSYLGDYLSAHCTTMKKDLSSAPLLAFFDPLADILFCWYHSQMFQRHLQSETRSFSQVMAPLLSAATKIISRGPGSKNKPVLLALCMEVILPLKMHILVKTDRDLVELYSEQKASHAAKLTMDDLKAEIISVLEAKPPSQLSRGRQLVKRLSSSFMLTSELPVEARALQIAFLSRARRHMQQMEIPAKVHYLWRQVLTYRKKKAVVNCFHAVAFFKLKKPQAINCFLKAFCRTWLVSDTKPSSHQVLAQVLLSNKSLEDSHSRAEPHPQDPLTQLFSTVKRSALSHDISRINERLYTAYTELLSENVLGSVEDSAEDLMVEMYHLAKSTLVERQEQLSVRGAAGVVTAVITATNGVVSPIAYSTLKLGIVLLTEGNSKIQGEIQDHLKTMDIGFLSSINQFIVACSVLDWDTYERQRQVGPMGADVTLGVLIDHDFTISLFRFLQLLCEGHNLSFQNYLRTQSGKSTTLNIVGFTVDYLLRLQESITDFYHHYSSDALIGYAGRQSFSTAFKVAKQVIRTLTEYVQGPCVENQQALANSRLWDAVSGFLQVFSAMQRHLYLHTGHIELLRELLALQEELFILMRSMLEGSSMSSNIGRQMVDTLMDMGSSLQEIVSFFTIFVKLQDVAICEAFKTYDLNKDGFISRKEFEKALTAQQKYSMAEIEYLMDCADSNHDGILDYAEFTERFHQPAKDIGFHLCVLIVQLSECQPQDKRLRQFIGSPAAIELVHHYKSCMGCVEIMGKSQKVERLYFELQEGHVKQWENPQIQDSYKDFLHHVDMSSQRTKLSDFVDFCDDTIFEIDNACAISGSEEKMARAKEVLQAHTGAVRPPTQLQFLSQPVSQRQRARPRPYILSFFIVPWLLLLVGMSQVKKQGARCIRAIFSRVKREHSTTSSTSTSEGDTPLSYAKQMAGASEYEQLASYLPKLSIFKQNWQAFFALHYHTLTNIALITTFLINSCLLAFKVHDFPPTDQLSQEDVALEDHTFLPMFITLLALVHFVTSCAIVMSYCCLMVPVIIFKREKTIARNMSVEWFEEQPPQSLSERWDRLAAMSRSFPRKYWDKQVSMQVKSSFATHKDTVIDLIYSIVDIRYIIWAFGVILSNKHVIYRLCYCAISFLGLQLSVFFFSFHLLDFVHNFKLVRTVLRSVLHNGKQLLMTMLMTTVVIYIYTVVAFNFFRKFYPKEAAIVEGVELHSCNSMVRCFLFHINQGLRSGGGIADVLEPAAGDSYEFLRLLFDITFFFVVVVILLAIIQGLIVDAFGQLRDQEDAITEEMQTKCFICGLGNTEFDHIPHGFDNHINKDHFMAHYMFLLLYLIKKRESEFSGQESFVWEMYLKRNWDIFPVGKCFQLQETTGSSSETAN